MAGIEEPEFHFFVGQDISCHLCAHQFPRWSALYEVVFDHPLFEGFRHYRPSIIDSELLFDQGAMLIGCCGSNAIDHAVWKCALLNQPVPKNGIPQLGERRQHLLGNFTVALDVVARHQRERRKPPCTPAIEGLQEISKRTAGFMRVSEIILNVRILLVQISGRLINIVSAFRNRKRNNPGLGGCHLFNYLLGIVRAE